MAIARIERKPDFTNTGEDKGVRTAHLANDRVDLWWMNFGAAALAIETRDKSRNWGNILGGFDSLDRYLVNDSYQGVVVGRVANRIRNGMYTQPDDTNPDDEEYAPVGLSKNEKDRNTLHGGREGWSKRTWDIVDCGLDGDVAQLILGLKSPHTDQGFPGEVDARVIIQLIGDKVILRYGASCDITTPVNMTWHGYLNLNGFNSTTIHDHFLTTSATHYLPTVDLIPTGEVLSVDGTQYDFRTAQRLGDPRRFGDSGYDDFLVFDPSETNRWFEFYAPDSGRFARCITDQPGFQLYTSFFLGKEAGFRQFQAACGETGMPNDFPNHMEQFEPWGAHFTGKGRAYHHKTTIQLGVKGK